MRTDPRPGDDLTGQRGPEEPPVLRGGRLDGALAWSSERHEELWLGHRDRPSEQLVRDASLLSSSVPGDYPGGHPEGFPTRSSISTARCTGPSRPARCRTSPTSRPSRTGTRRCCSARRSPSLPRTRAWTEVAREVVTYFAVACQLLRTRTDFLLTEAEAPVTLSRTARFRALRRTRSRALSGQGRDGRGQTHGPLASTHSPDVFR